MVSLTNFKRVRDHDELAMGSYDNPAFAAGPSGQQPHDSRQADTPVNSVGGEQPPGQPQRRSPTSSGTSSQPIRILVECPSQQQPHNSSANSKRQSQQQQGAQPDQKPIACQVSPSTSSGDSESQDRSVGSSGDSGVIEHQQSAISFYSSSGSSSHKSDDDDADTVGSVSSSSLAQLRRSSAGAALEGVIDDDVGSFAGGTLDNRQQQQQPSDKHSETGPHQRYNATTVNVARQLSGAKPAPGKLLSQHGQHGPHAGPPQSIEAANLKMAVPQLVTLNSAQADKQRAAQPATPVSCDSEQLLVDGRHFEIRWNDLYYQVQPKWYQHKWRSLFNTSHNNSSGARDNCPSSVGIDDGRPATPNAPTGQHKATPNTTVRILNNLNGSVRSGQVTAILGPSGAGKTSLLGCLTGKNKTGVSGTIQVKGGPDKPLSICTIPQKDYLLNQLTVRENLWFASRLKHPEDNFDHDSNISRVLALLKLESCVATKISKISGGQYKRVSIAQELLSNPDILILDEPTSGLDSLTCYKTVMVLRDLAQLSPNPMAIIVTIHQPQREVFDLFNHVYILAVGGQAIYEGRPSQAIETIAKCQAGNIDASSYNPASYLVEIASAEFGYKPIESLAEHQLREFKRRTLEQDYRQLQQQQQLDTPTPGYASTPGGHRKRQSPIVARFKSTFGLGSAAGQPAPISATGHTPPLGSPASLRHLGSHHHLPTIHEPSAAVRQPEPLDTASLQVSMFGGSRLELTAPSADGAAAGGHEPVGKLSGHALSSGDFFLDDRLQTHKHNHDGHFFRHCKLLTKRSWLCLCKDPMLTTLRFAAHIFVPLLITLVYGNRVGKPNACPLYESDMDLIDYAKRGATRLLGLQDELRCTFENVGLYFLSIYAFTFSTMCLTSLSFPLNMHVLLKEVRNGWYSIPTFFIGKTLADFPLEFILPTVTLMITYPLTGQPSSYMEWRFLVGTLIFVLTSLIAQTQGLIFGALFMNAMQAAVFVAPVSTTPLILLSGFLIRIGQMPRYLQIMSSFSYFRYAIEGLTIIRYGFGMCPCDPEVVTGQPVTASGVPEQLRTMTNYWLSTFNQDNAAAADDNSTITAITALNGTANAGDAVAETDFFQDLTVLLARANSFGANITTCEDLKPYPMIDFNLKDDQLYIWMAGLVATLVVSKIINYLVVKYSVKFRL